MPPRRVLITMLTKEEIIEYSDLVYAKHGIRLTREEAVKSAMGLVGFVKAVMDKHQNINEDLEDKL